VPLRNRYEALEPEGQAIGEADEGPRTGLPRTRQSAPCIMSASTKKKRRIIVIGDSLLRGTEGPICRPDPSHGEVCCLPGARVRDITRKLPGLVRPSDYYPLLVVQVGSDEVRTKSVQEIKRDFRALGQQVKGSGAQVVFSSIPPTAGKDEGRNRKSQQINTWLQAWCQRQNLGFFHHGSVYMAAGMLATDGVRLSQKGKRILAQYLARLIDRALN